MTISDLVKTQKAAFKKGLIRSYEKRVHYLKRMREMISENEEELCSAVYSDFGKPYAEAYTTEIYTLLHEIDYHLKHLSGWMKPASVSGYMAVFPSRNVVYSRPFGTVLVIGAWNYPIYLSLMPVVGALSAGNTVVLKPSELSSNTSSLLAKLTDHYFENQVFRVVEGAVDETQKLLSQPFDKIFFTGSTRVGKIVMKAAAEQLIPVTLELGGKSPAIVHHDSNLDVATKRIWWGKTINAGQTCVAPDFVFIHESAKDSFIEKSKEVLGAFFENDYIVGENFCRIINRHNFDRLTGLMEASNVVFGGSTNRETLFIEPAVIDAGWDDKIMQEEIFGPLLPVVTYADQTEIVEKLTAMPAPLALYLFTEDESLQSHVLENVPFGGGCINETVTHLGNPNLPFGGAGQSGMGSYHGKYSFDAFTRKQGVLTKPIWPDPDVKYPPYDETKLKWFKKLFS
jgi:aldehyde dehydrogenase (NAD+)